MHAVRNIQARFLSYFLCSLFAFTYAAMPRCRGHLTNASAILPTLILSIKQKINRELKNKNIKLVWTGIRKISEFYVTQSDKPSLYKESNRELSKRWAPDEPVHDCVALDIVSDYLVTLPCNTELEFICQNNGFPIYPVTETLICPEEWLFFYQLPVSRKKCIRPFIRSKNIDDAEETCLKSGSNIADLQDYFFLAYIHEYLEYSRFWIT
ncbi:uncharacterized protein CEXT_431991 [Caerostris extrusa]|uniref:C-type lectin domain-containing protein n=1 Tax=Caerostris extrusa TaxID=172846 RepID=A0AAV4Y1U3_CAEEX|nr:uncharacterized protein CEXT_431991 [Caerostris extrusa]